MRRTYLLKEKLVCAKHYQVLYAIKCWLWLLGCMLFQTLWHKESWFYLTVLKSMSGLYTVKTNLLILGRMLNLHLYPCIHSWTETRRQTGERQASGGFVLQRLVRLASTEYQTDSQTLGANWGYPYQVSTDKHGHTVDFAIIELQCRAS